MSLHRRLAEHLLCFQQHLKHFAINQSHVSEEDCSMNKAYFYYDIVENLTCAETSKHAN